MPRAVLLLIAFVALIRLPFLNQAFQLDDYYYLKAAQHALTDPLHPHHAKYVFLGIEFDMRGHPHPPGNAWILALLLKLFGAAREIPLHLAWIVFTAGAVWAAYKIAKRLTPANALEVTLLACSAPVFITAGNSLFTDLPFLCFWTLAIAFGLEAGERRARAWLCAASLAAAAAISYQAVVAVPILGLFWWRRGWLRELWWLLAAPLVIVIGYQLLERLTGGAAPAKVLAGHFQQFGLQRFEMKLKNAAALTAHLAWMASPLLVAAFARQIRRALWAIPIMALGLGILADGSPLFWIPFACGALVLVWIAAQRDVELRAWFAIYFLASLAIFFAGAARYLLPAMLPLALLAGRAFEPNRWLLRGAAALNICLGLALGSVDYQVGSAYRELAARWLPKREPVWINAEWGLREYAERGGARPLLRGTSIGAGEWLISSALAEQVNYAMQGVDPETAGQAIIRPTLPLRLMGLGARSAYETVGFGLRPFDVTSAPVDIVTLTRFKRLDAELTWLRVVEPGADSQIVSGVYPRENPEWRWTGGRAEFLLKAPAGPARLRAEGAIPASAPGRVVELLLEGKTIAATRLNGPGQFTVESGEISISGPSARVEVRIDRDFSPGGGDQRRLGLILTAIGFAPSQAPPVPPEPAKR